MTWVAHDDTRAQDDMVAQDDMGASDDGVAAGIMRVLLGG
jgi:hypothetical protein